MWLLGGQLPAAAALVLAAYAQGGPRLSGTVLWLGGAAIVACGVVAVLVVERAVERRVALLVDGAGRLLRGEAPDIRAPLAGDALGRLEVAFRTLADHLRESDASIRAEAERQSLDTKIQRAVGLADSEAEVVEVAGRALARVVPALPSEVLLADSRGTQLHLAAVSASGLSPGCPVECPSACAALRRGQTLRFARSDDIDACPRLRDRPEGACSAVCLPVNVMGRAIGVVHVTAPVDAPPGDHAVAALESIATHMGARLAMLDSLEKFQVQAATDPLTGVLNRRSFEEAATRLLRSSKPMSVVVCDLDEFKKLNDELGHEAGDRALKVFVQVMTAVLRSSDVFGRIGGEEFGVVLPCGDLEEVVAVLERCRAALAVASESLGPRRFTASWGLSWYPRDGQHLSDLLRAADAAMYESKRAGRDRITVAGARPAPATRSHRPANDSTAPGAPEVMSPDLPASIPDLEMVS